MTDTETPASYARSSERPSGTRRFFGYLSRHIVAITIGVAVATLLATPLAASRGDAQPNFDPTGEIYEVHALAEDQFESSSPTRLAPFLTEANGDDALTREVLLEWKANQDRALSNPDLAGHFGTQFNPDLGVQIDGIHSIADEVDLLLPAGLAGATEAETKLAIAAVLDEGSETSNFRDTLSQETSTAVEQLAGEDVDVWRSPVFMTWVVYDRESFEDFDDDNNFSGVGLDAQQWLRDVQDDVRGDEVSYAAWGVAIDSDLTFEEQLAAASPYILFAVVGILILVGALLRSYWAAIVVAIGLGVTMILYSAALTIIGFDAGSMLLSFVAPIATISFGVDFFVHASGRAREEQVEGADRERSYVLGLVAVFGAITLAVASSSLAFASNAVAGIEAIAQFGIGAGIALIIAFAILGLIVPKWLLAVEDRLGDPPADRGLMIPEKLGFLMMSVVAGLAVTMTVVLPAVGAAVLAVAAIVCLWLPYLRVRRRNRRAREAGRPTTSEIKGAGHGFRPAGTVVHFLARWRVVTIPITFALAVLGAIGFTQVESEFTFSDFFSEDTDFIQSFNRFDDHFGSSSGGGNGMIYVSGDLTDPAVLVALADAEDELDVADRASDVPFLNRNLDGDPTFGNSSLTLVRTAMASPRAQQAITATTGVAITDVDNNGLPDTADQVGAIYSHALTEGVINDEGFVVFESTSVTEFLYRDPDGTWATPLEISIPTFTDDAIILDARAALEGAAETMLAGPAGPSIDRAVATGNEVTSQDSLAAFTDAMLIALPVALLLCGIVASVFMRSLKYGLAAVTPIVLVVGWVYGFMYLFDYKINVVTATIAAIAVGVGIDFSTHFTMRFREEFAEEPSRFPALRRAGEGTGGALAISALSSIIGFSVMAMAPMPIFATFGTLTAVMIFLSLALALLVLPSLLLLATPSRKGEERQRIFDLRGLDEESYQPHARSTATEPVGAQR